MRLWIRYSYHRLHSARTFPSPTTVTSWYENGKGKPRSTWMKLKKESLTVSVIRRSKATMWIGQRIIAVSIVFGLAFLVHFHLRRRRNQAERDTPNGIWQQVRYGKQRRRQQKQQRAPIWLVIQIRIENARSLLLCVWVTVRFVRHYLIWLCFAATSSRGRRQPTCRVTLVA